jgi:hypothetical protein
MKRCPPGVICIENVTIFFIIVILFCIGYYMYLRVSKQNNPNKYKEEINVSTVIQERPNMSSYGYGFGYEPNYPYNNLPKNVLENPYAAPLKDERYFVSESAYIPPNSRPINVSTSAIDTAYRQLGILTPLNGSSKDNILPLMGRPLFTRRSKFNYYTISNQHNNVKLPISVNGKSGLSEVGVDEIFNGDTVYVEGTNEAYKVTIYESETIKYLPVI